MNEKSTEKSDGAQDKDQFPSGFIVEDSSIEELLARVIKLERRNKVVIYTFALFLTVALIGLGGEIFNQTVIVQQKLMESRELTLVDNQGNERLFIRMFSRVPVLQVLDSNGKPRISMGLRFDDTPFIDMSDRKGNTRTTLEITADDSPALSMFNEKGDTTFTIN